VDGEGDEVVLGVQVEVGIGDLKWWRKSRWRRRRVC